MCGTEGPARDMQNDEEDDTSIFMLLSMFSLCTSTTVPFLSLISWSNLISGHMLSICTLM